MSINIDNSFWSNTLSEVIGGIILITLVFLGRSFINPIWQVIYSKAPVVLRNLLLKVLSILSKPFFLLVAFFIFQILIFLDIYRVLGLIANSLILLRFYDFSKSVFIVRSASVLKFTDGFHKLEDIKKNWETITGKPSLDEERGNPKPSLQLIKVDPPQATNTFLILKGITAKSGEIECDYFLEHGALLNVVFMCDKTNHNWHMARFDSRGGTTDGLLIKDGGKGNNWRFNNMSTSRSNTGNWYRAKIEFGSDQVRMFRNGELVSEITNPQIFGNYIGLFNECANVNIDNFKFSEK